MRLSYWLDYSTRVEEAANFYVSTFPLHAKIKHKTGPGGKVRSVSMEMFGHEVILVNDGNRAAQFSPSAAFVITVKDQSELDQVWDKLTASGGKPGAFGRLTDKFGMHWQVWPEILEKMLADPDEEKSGRVMQAMLNMTKLDIDVLKQWYGGS